MRRTILEEQAYFTQTEDIKMTNQIPVLFHEKDMNIGQDILLSDGQNNSHEPIEVPNI